MAHFLPSRHGAATAHIIDFAMVGCAFPLLNTNTSTVRERWRLSCRHSAHTPTLLWGAALPLSDPVDASPLPPASRGPPVCTGVHVHGKLSHLLGSRLHRLCCGCVGAGSTKRRLVVDHTRRERPSAARTRAPVTYTRIMGVKHSFCGHEREPRVGTPAGHRGPGARGE